MTDQIKNLISQILMGIGGYFVGRGWVTTDQLTNIIIPAVIGLLGLGYSIYLNTRSAKVASVATPGTMVVLPAKEAALAAALPSNVATTNEVAIVAK